MKTCIKGGLVINPSTKMEEIADTLIEHGVIIAMGDEGEEGMNSLLAGGKG